MCEPKKYYVFDGKSYIRAEDYEKEIADYDNRLEEAIKKLSEYAFK